MPWSSCWQIFLYSDGIDMSFAYFSLLNFFLEMRAHISLNSLRLIYEDEHTTSCESMVFLSDHMVNLWELASLNDLFDLFLPDF